MKYFTKELWIGFQGENWKENDRLWEENLIAYQAQYEKLKKRLDHNEFLFFKNTSLHDSSITDIVIRDLNNEKYKADRINVKIPTTIHIEVLHASSDSIYILKYHDVRRFCFDSPTNSPLFYTEKNGISRWGYDEITLYDKKSLSHEIILASGTEISIVFGRIEVIDLNKN